MTRCIDVAELIDSPSALTQEQGDMAYREIVRSFEDDEVIQLDFSNVESMISPFLNNAVGQLYGKYTSEQIKEHLVLINFPDEKKATLNIVIGNAKKFYKNKEAFRKSAKEVLNVE